MNYIKEIVGRSGIGYVTKKYRLPSGQIQFIINRPNMPEASGYLIRVEGEAGKQTTNIYEYINDKGGALLRAFADGIMIKRAQMVAVDALESRLTQDLVFEFADAWENIV